MHHKLTHRGAQAKYRPLLFLLLILTTILAGCGGSEVQGNEQVNGFGTALNHTHSLVALPDNVLIMASHYGIFRSTDAGQNWTRVEGGEGQLMDGLMSESLIYAVDDPDRMYVLASEPSIGINATDYKGTLGLYRSSDQGQNWELAIEVADTGGRMRFVRPGNNSPDEIYIYVNELGDQGLQVSQDGGTTFTSTGTLPFSNLYSMLAVPGKPGELLICGEKGIARSTDNGQNWETLSITSNTVFEITTAGPDLPIYAAGDDGIFASQDGGQTFTLVHDERRLASLTASPTDPEIVYGKTGTSIFRSDDGAKTWEALPSIQGNFANLAIDAADPSLLYLSLSYPTAIQRYDNSSKEWSSLTPSVQN